MKQLIIEPDGWECKFKEYKSGYFVYNESLYLKSEYGGDAFCDSGEHFWGGTADKNIRDELIIQPVIIRWIKE